MNLGSRNQIGRTAGGAAVIGVLLASCATQEQYDEAVAQAKYHQTRVHETQRENAALQEEIDRLKASLAMSPVQAMESDFSSELQSRISELQAKLDGLGRPIGDIEYIDVEGGYIVVVQDKILFPSGSADVSGDGRGAIQGIARQIQSQPHGRVWVRGHTDSDPVVKPQTKERFPHGNLQLSAARAVEVAALLIAAGIDSRDVAVMGFGPHDPLKANDSADNKRFNRRVEIFVADTGS
jgi:flagellar motor protein MotB